MNLISKNPNRTKMICTMGPASTQPEILLEMIKAGVDVCRLNFSHGSHEDHQATLDLIRDINFRYQTNIGILVDLQGPKIRVGKLDSPFPINKGDEVYLSTAIKEQEGNKLPMVYETIAQDVKFDDMVLIDDGKVELRVLETNGTDTVKLKLS